jgi:SPP1 gp7 family putative phage head morphogenesis protein
VLEYNSHLLSVEVPKSEKEYVKALINAYGKAVTALLSTNGTYTKKYINEVLAQIRDELISINDDFAIKLQKDLFEINSIDVEALALETESVLFYINEAHKLYRLPKSIIQGIIDTKAMDFYRVDANGTMIVTSTTKSAMIKSIASTQYQKVKSVILGGIAVGDTPEKIVKSLKPYMTDSSIKDTRTVVKTLLAQGSQQAKNAFYDANPSVFDEYIYSAVIDISTSNICRSLDGRRFKERKPGIIPPLHPNCRSSLLQVPIGFDVGQRPIVLPNGDVEVVYDKNFTYRDALDRFPQLDDKKLIDVDLYLKQIGYYK